MEPTADLSDRHPDAQVVQPVFRDFGGRVAFCGPIATVRRFEDNSLVREALSAPGRSRVLVVDGGGSVQCALLGDQLATLASRNGWAGVVVNGAVRDSAVLAGIDIGVKALATHPRRSVKRGAGERDVTVSFAGVDFRPDAMVWADADGIVVLDEA